MLITHLKPTELWGKKVYDAEGQLLGEVVAIASCGGLVRKVLVQRKRSVPAVRVWPSPASRVEGTNLIVQASERSAPRLQLVR